MMKKWIFEGFCFVFLSENFSLLLCGFSLSLSHTHTHYIYIYIFFVERQFLTLFQFFLIFNYKCIRDDSTYKKMEF